MSRPPIPLRYALLKDMITWLIIGYTLNVWKVGIILHQLSDTHSEMVFDEKYWNLYLQMIGIVVPPLGAVLGLVWWPLPSY